MIIVTGGADLSAAPLSGSSIRQELITSSSLTVWEHRTNGIIWSIYGLSITSIRTIFWKWLTRIWCPLKWTRSSIWAPAHPPPNATPITCGTIIMLIQSYWRSGRWNAIFALSTPVRRQLTAMEQRDFRTIIKSSLNLNPSICTVIPNRYSICGCCARSSKAEWLESNFSMSSAPTNTTKAICPASFQGLSSDQRNRQGQTFQIL